MTTYAKTGVGSWGPVADAPPAGDTTTYLDDVAMLHYSGGTAPGSLTHLDDYGTILFGPGTYVSTFGPKAGRCLKYVWNHSAVDEDWGLNISEARALTAQYELKDTAGVVVDPGTQGPWCDVANVSYQNEQKTIILNWLAANPTCDGIFVDNFDTFLGNYSLGTSDVFPLYKHDGTTVAVGNNTDYQNAQLSWAANVAAAVIAAGKLVVMNAGVTYILGANGGDIGLFSGHSGGSPTPFYDGTYTLYWASLYKDSATGMMVEHWLQEAASPFAVHLNTHSDFRHYWTENAVDFPPLLQGYGLDFYPLNHVYSSGASVARYMRASYLMGWDGGIGSQIWAKDAAYNLDPWVAELALDVGQPLASVVASGAGWYRDFEHYRVKINPSASTATIDGTSIASGDAAFV